MVACRAVDLWCLATMNARGKANSVQPVARCRGFAIRVGSASRSGRM